MWPTLGVNVGSKDQIFGGQQLSELHVHHCLLFIHAQSLFTTIDGNESSSFQKNSLDIITPTCLGMAPERQAHRPEHVQVLRHGPSTAVDIIDILSDTEHVDIEVDHDRRWHLHPCSSVCITSHNNVAGD